MITYTLYLLVALYILGTAHLRVEVRFYDGIYDASVGALLVIPVLICIFLWQFANFFTHLEQGAMRDRINIC